MVETAMNELAVNITLRDGVKGCAFFHREQGVLVWDGDGSIGEEVLRELGVSLVKLHLLGGKNGLKIQASHFSFRDLNVIGVPYSPEVIVLICCVEGCDTDGLLQLMAKGRAAAGKRKKDLEVTQELDYSLYKGLVELPDDLSSTLDMMGEDEEIETMRPYYEQLYEALVELIGPLAEYVVQDSLARWRADGPAIPARIFELVTMMMEEIEDPNLAEEFLHRFDKMS